MLLFCTAECLILTVGHHPEFLCHLYEIFLFRSKLFTRQIKTKKRTLQNTVFGGTNTDLKYEIGGGLPYIV